MINRIKRAVTSLIRAPKALAKQPPAREIGHPLKSRFDGVAGTKTFDQTRRLAKRALARDFFEVRNGLRNANDAAVKRGAIGIGNRLGIPTKHFERLTGREALTDLGRALGGDKRYVFQDGFEGLKGLRNMGHMHLCASRGINDPDPTGRSRLV